jgi:hypothetical protein
MRDRQVERDGGNNNHHHDHNRARLGGSFQLKKKEIN